MPGIDILGKAQRIVVLPNTSTSIVKEGPNGPPGPPGPIGPTGPSGGPPGPRGPGIVVSVIEDQPTWDEDAVNNDAAFASACLEAFNAGGGSVLLPRLLKVDLESVVPHSVDLVGLGALPGVSASSEILCLSPTSGVRFGTDEEFLGFVGSGGARSGGFRINGNNIALNPMRCSVGTRAYSNIIIENAAEDGLVLASAQNSLFEMIEVNSSGRDNYVFDLGAGGNHFLKCESHSAGRSSLAFRATGEGLGGTPFPLCNIIENMIMEYTTSSAGPMVQHGAGLMNRLVNCLIVSDHPLSSMDDPSIIRVNPDYTVGEVLQYSVMEMDGGTVQCNGTGTDLRAFDVGENAVLYLNGSLTVVGVGIMFRTVPGAIIYDGSNLTFTGVSPFTRLEGDDYTVRNVTRTRLMFSRPLAEPAIQVFQDGEGNARYGLYGNGMTWYGSGSESIDTNWYRKAVGCIGSDYAIGVGVCTTITRPSASVVGAGAVMFDVTIGSYICSNGSVWKVLVYDDDLRFTTLSTDTRTVSHVLTLVNAGRIQEMNVATANTLTIPTNASVAFPVGTVIPCRNYGVGQTTIIPADGTVTIRSEGGKLKSSGQYAEWNLTKRATNEWVASGSLVA